MEGEMVDRRALIEEFIAAWNSRDVQAVMALMSHDCEFHASVGPEPGASYIGRQAVTRAFAAILQVAVDPHLESGPVSILAEAEFAVTRWSTRTRPPGGTSVLVTACDVFEFEGDRIKAKDTYRKVAGEAPR
jgi:uncharacterized protein (TIGR02246 family)